MLEKITVLGEVYCEIYTLKLCIDQFLYALFIYEYIIFTFAARNAFKSYWVFVLEVQLYQALLLSFYGRNLLSSD